jgi:hypothetical protein
MDTQEIIDRYQGDADKWGKSELAAITLLKLSDDMESDQLVAKSRARQNGIALLEYIQANSPTFSLQRIQLIEALKKTEV